MCSINVFRKRKLTGNDFEKSLLQQQLCSCESNWYNEWPQVNAENEFGLCVITMTNASMDVALGEVEVRCVDCWIKMNYSEIQWKRS